MSSEKKSVLILGGGLAGLAAAKRLTDKGFQVKVLEKREIFGGKVSSWKDEEGDWIESGTHCFFGAYKVLYDLMKEIKTDHAVLWKEHKLTYTLAGGGHFTFKTWDLPSPLHLLPAIASKAAIKQGVPLIVQATGGGARMHEGCSSMVGLPKLHVAISSVERAGLPVISIITDPTLGGVAIGIASRGIKLFEHNAGNIGFSGKRVIEQYTGKPTTRDFQTTWWLQQKGFVERTSLPQNMKFKITDILKEYRIEQEQLEAQEA